jgi:cyclic pyranopterin phosphate synthase
MSPLTHLDESGNARMVDVSAKPSTARTAVAEGCIRMSAGALAAITGGTAPKGDVLATARIAGIMAAKRTSELIPLCHPLPLSAATVDLSAGPDCVHVTATVRTTHSTGVEMEALTAATVALLTVYDMVKAVDRGMVIEGVRLLSKSGGRSGDWTASQA